MGSVGGLGPAPQKTSRRNFETDFCGCAWLSRPFIYSKLQAAKLAVPRYSVCTQSAWNDNESIHGKSRGKGCGSAQLPPTSVDGGGDFLQCIIEQKRGCKEGKEVREWMRKGMQEREYGLQRVGGRESERIRERESERTLPRRMIERGGEEAKLPQMK